MKQLPIEDPSKLLEQLEKDISKLKDHEIGEIRVGDLRQILKLIKEQEA